MTLSKRDPFEYPLRSKTVVMEELKSIDFPINVSIKTYSDGEEANSYMADKSRKVLSRNLGSIINEYERYVFKQITKIKIDIIIRTQIQKYRYF